MATPTDVNPIVRRGAAYAWRLLVLAAAAYGVLWALGQLRIVALPIAVALLVARALDPVASRLKRRGVAPAPTAAIVVGGLLALVAASGWFIVPEVAREFADLGPTVSAAIEDLEDWLVEDAPVDVSRADITTAREWIGERAMDTLRGSGGALSNGAFLVANFVAGLLLAVLLSFFMVKDGPRALAWARGFVPSGRRGIADQVARRSWQTLGGYLAGSGMLGTVEAIVIGLAVLLVGGTLVVPIMILTFAAAFVPIVGAITAGAIAVLVTVVTAGTTEALIVLAVAVLVQQFDNDLLAPLVFGRTLEIHPAIVLIVITAGGSLFGFVGVLVAVPTTAVVINALAVLRANDVGSDDSIEVADASTPTDGLILPGSALVGDTALAGDTARSGDASPGDAAPTVRPDAPGRPS